MLSSASVRKWSIQDWQECALMQRLKVWGLIILFPCWRRVSSMKRSQLKRPAGGTSYQVIWLLIIDWLISNLFLHFRIIDASTLRIFDHETWPSISRYQSVLTQQSSESLDPLSPPWSRGAASPPLRASSTELCWSGRSTGSEPATTRPCRRPSPSSSPRLSSSTWEWESSSTMLYPATLSTMMNSSSELYCQHDSLSSIPELAALMWWRDQSGEQRHWRSRAQWSRYLSIVSSTRSVSGSEQIHTPGITDQSAARIL